MARYIDADMFKRKLADKDIFFPALFENELNEMPTANVAEVKHGEWLDDIQEFSSPAGVTQKYLVGYKCSLCGRTERIKEPYCNCGAKMDERSGT